MKNSIFCVLLVSLISNFSLEAQVSNNRTENLSYYDQKPFHYGILIGIHSSIFKLEHSPEFLDIDTIASILPQNSAGFTLGGIVNFKLAEYLDVRVTPSVGFFEYNVEYNFLSPQPRRQIESISSTNVELPLLFKYKSKKRKNLRMYLIGGIKASFEASGNREDDEVEERLRINGNTLSVEYGFGLDIYYPLFKFSPEIRFSQGVIDIHKQENNGLSLPIQSLKINTINLYLIFQ